MEAVEYKNISFSVWDIGGEEKVKNSLSYRKAYVHLHMERQKNWNKNSVCFLHNNLPK